MTKKKYLIQLGNLIDKIHRIETDHKMSFGDLNEYNFIIDQQGCLRAIDLDSSYVDGFDEITPPSMSYYLLNNTHLEDTALKYPETDDCIIIPDRNSDLYSYHMILLSVLGGQPIFREEIDKYYQYLDFLRELGVSQALIDSFIQLYTPKDNENPRQLIESLDDMLPHKSSYVQFQKKYHL